jgi:hypothetical protein
MILTIELTPHEEARLIAAAQQEGMQPAELARKLLTDHLLQETSKTDPTLARFVQWKSEDAQMTPEDLEQERGLWERFELGINETRRSLEMREL